MLNDLSCKALITESKRNSKPLKKSDGNGLLLHAFPNGRAFWYHRYTINGQRKQLAYGQYPLVSLSDAKIKHGESYKLIKKGIDPLDARREKVVKAKREANNGFQSVSERWYDHNIENWSARHARRLKNRLRKNLYPKLKKRPISQITRKELLTVLREIEACSRETAKRCTQYLIGIFRYALDEELIQVNIALDLRSSLKPFRQGHYASMDIDDLPGFLKCLAAYDGNNAADKRDVVELLMLTLVRSMELLTAEWTEFDLEKSTWKIPAAKMKMKKPHLVPLSRQAKAILLKRWQTNFSASNLYPSKYVFPSVYKLGKHLCHTTASKMLVDIGYSGKHSSHGFRSLGMGIAKERLEYAHEVPDRQLAHEPVGDVNRAYDRASFLKKRIEMMQRLADYIDQQRKVAGENLQADTERPIPLNPSCNAVQNQNNLATA